jgi:hypothetical protein
VQVLDGVDSVDVTGEEGSIAGDVTGLVTPVAYLSRHPQNHPGVEQWCDTGGDFAELVDEVGSRQPPNQPRWWQEDVERKEDDEVVGAAVIGGAGIEVGGEVADVVVVGSLHPNQPGVLHVEVEVVEEVKVGLVVPVVLSRHPHQPGVLQVEVRVRVVVLVVEEDVVVADPLLSKYFQLKQSTHSSSSTHCGG